MVGCLHGCDPERNPAVFWVRLGEGGCICRDEQMQALCPQHYISMTPVGPVLWECYTSNVKTT